ncbi:unnamed protein product [Protopolystoma xenopodis]|uniref:Uncharacterized protein n=1 Tax=Protopolystoma xenopodis TaxID=117903 RepID=A0A3S5BLF9_9PLAT|nr:unnamed protein product [Protopolystoma xenopodis]
MRKYEAIRQMSLPESGVYAPSYANYIQNVISPILVSPVRLGGVGRDDLSDYPISPIGPCSSDGLSPVEEFWQTLM